MTESRSPTPLPWRFAALLGCLALHGCGTPPPARWLSLPLPVQGAANGASSSSAAPAQQKDQPVLVVRRVGVPEYLQTNKVRYRASDSVLREWPDILWSERLEVGMTDHMVMRLRAALPGWTVCDRICPPGVPRATLGLDFAPLDLMQAAGELKAGARWQITLRQQQAEGAGRTIISGAHDYAVPVQASGAEQQAAAMGRLLDGVTRDIAGSLQASSVSN